MTTPKELFSKARQECDDALAFFKQEISAIRTGRATPALVEDILVEYFGSKLKIKELASITTPESRTLLIQPWDKNALEPISSAISKSSIGLAPIADGQLIRLNLPALTEERRKEFIKLLKRKTEESRIKIRKTRDEVRDHIAKLAKSGDMREDDKFKSQEDLQKIVDEYNTKIEELEKKKEQELLS